jgi:hypothetical protein
MRKTFFGALATLLFVTSGVVQAQNADDNPPPKDAPPPAVERDAPPARDPAPPPKVERDAPPARDAGPQVERDTPINRDVPLPKTDQPGKIEKVPADRGPAVEDRRGGPMVERDPLPGDRRASDLNRDDMNRGANNNQDIRWRYKFHNGEWWFWTTQNRWMYYRNGQWNDYNPESFTRMYPEPTSYDNSATYYGNGGGGYYGPRGRYYGGGYSGAYYGPGYGYGYGPYNGAYGYGNGYGAYGYNGPGYYGQGYGGFNYGSRGANQGSNIGGVIGNSIGGPRGAGLGAGVGAAIGR